MFQIGGLIVLCGLLARTMAQSETPVLPSEEPVPPSEKPVVPSEEPVPPSEEPVPPSDPAGPTDQNPTGLIETLKNTFTNGLISKDLLNTLKNIPLIDTLKKQGSNLLGPLRPFLDIIDFKITDARLLQLSIKPSPDGHSLQTTVPLGLNFGLNLPMVGSLLAVNMQLNASGTIESVTDQEGEVHLVFGNCESSLGSLDVIVLNRKFPPIQNFADTVRVALTRDFLGQVRSQVCTALNTMLSQLDVTLASNIAKGLIQGMDLDLTV